ncbi:SH3 domain-containing protein [Ancylobacter sp. 6x-1]|uniref:SH3 domain-containing protein n=1 Tax=Ancylobacter crimeensis TaxID=2579147 RepID=A0ABT0DA86_9HYPH|nr:SH3 domain-containing protein [Ancylobacter crimeensis]MCK0196850.1 SH3 domain-containing protein [Ancylobacter crimeensis]
MSAAPARTSAPSRAEPVRPEPQPAEAPDASSPRRSLSAQAARIAAELRDPVARPASERPRGAASERLMAERIAVDSLLSAGGLARPENSRAAAERAARERRAPAEATYGLRGALDGQNAAQAPRSGAAQAVSLLRPSAPAGTAYASRAEAFPAGVPASVEGAARFGLRPGGRDEADDSKAVVRRAQRRKSGSQTFTWQRFAVLALVVAIAGGAGIVLQSLASRNDDMAETGPASGQLVASNVVNSGDLARAQQPPVRQAAPYTPVQPGAAASSGSTSSGPAASAVPPRGAAAQPAAQPAEAPAQTLADAEPPIGRAGSDAAVEDTGAGSGAANAGAAGDSGGGASVATLPQTAPLPKQKPKIAAVAPPSPRPSTATAFAAPTSIAANTPVANAEPTEPDAADAADSPDADAGAAPASGANSGPGTVRRTVTVRAAPGGASIGVLRPGQKVSVVSCDSWCRIEFDGKTGYIFKSFVSVGG